MFTGPRLSVSAFFCVDPSAPSAFCPSTNTLEASMPAVVDIATFTGSVPTPTQTISCDSSLGKIARTTNGKGYLLNCSFQFPGNDLAQLHTADWATCMEACSVAAGCKAFEFHSNVVGENCNLKTAGDPHIWDVGDKIWIGWEVDTQLKPSTTSTTSHTDTKLKTVQITPLPTPQAPLHFEPDPNNYSKNCYMCGLSASRADIVPAIQFFCANQTLGTYYPDRLLQDGDSISLEYRAGDSTDTAIVIIVTAKAGCVIDFASLGDGTCEAILGSGGPLDRCNMLDASEKQGGEMEDGCTKWILDVQPSTGSYSTCDPFCHTWRKGIYDGDEQDSGFCADPDFGGHGGGSPQR